MAPLKVPERFREGIVQIAKLSQEKFEELAQAVAKAPSCKDTRELLAWIADETPSFKSRERQDIITPIISMFRVQQISDVEPKVFGRDVVESIASESPQILKGVSGPDLIDRIASLLENSSLDLASSRIGDAKREVERNFCMIRVFTDLRPTFTANLGEAPTDMAIIHNLQIGWHDSMSNHKEFYISLDASDLEKLKKAIVEAEKKAETLERMLVAEKLRLHK